MGRFSVGQGLQVEGKIIFCHSERSEESLFRFLSLNRSEIPRFARNDKVLLLAVHESQITIHESPLSKRQRSIVSFKLGERNHIDGVPRAAFEERAVGAFAGAQLAADAEQWIDDNAAKRGVVFVRRPIHAIRNRTVLDAGGRTGASRAAFIDHRKNVGFAFPLRRRARGYGRLLDDYPRLKFLDARSRIRHVEPPIVKVSATYSY